MKMEPEEIISRVVGAYLVPGKTYPKPLPADLAPWYRYTKDSGHSILVCVNRLYDPAQPEESMVPAPVRQVLRVGWIMRGGFPVCELPYDDNIGLLSEEDDDEF
jgi:hypothetical protein